jgi:hypothetical protein
MSNFGDPGFEYHKLLAQFWGLLLLDLSENPMLPFDMEAYGRYVTGWVKDLDEFAKSKKADVNTKRMHEAAATLEANAAQFQEWTRVWHDSVWGSGGYESNVMAIQRVNHNMQMASFDTHLLDLADGGGVSFGSISSILKLKLIIMLMQIPNRTQFRHVVFGPELWAGYDASIFPAIRDSINTGNWSLAQYWIDRVADTVDLASGKLLS